MTVALWYGVLLKHPDGTLERGHVHRSKRLAQVCAARHPDAYVEALPETTILPIAEREGLYVDSRTMAQLVQQVKVKTGVSNAAARKLAERACDLLIAEAKRPKREDSTGEPF